MSDFFPFLRVLLFRGNGDGLRGETFFGDDVVVVVDDEEEAVDEILVGDFSDVLLPLFSL